jgi:tetratricopeptide (TPR) repeat protein
MSDRPAELSTPEFEDDAETIALANNPKFLEILERSRQRHQAEGGISLEEMRRRLGLDQLPEQLLEAFLHEEAMDLVEQSAAVKAEGNHTQAAQLLQQAFENEAEAAELLADDLGAEPMRSSLHRSAASLAIECGNFQVAERLIVTALTGNPLEEIAEELKDLFVQINLRQYVERRGVELDELPSALQAL